MAAGPYLGAPVTIAAPGCLAVACGRDDLLKVIPLGELVDHVVEDCHLVVAQNESLGRHGQMVPARPTARTSAPPLGDGGPCSLTLALSAHRRGCLQASLSQVLRVRGPRSHGHPE